MSARIEADEGKKQKQPIAATKKLVDGTMKMLEYDRFELRRIKEPLHHNKTNKLYTFFSRFWHILAALHYTYVKDEKRIGCFFLFILSQLDTTLQTSNDSHLQHTNNGRFIIELLFILFSFFCCFFSFSWSQIYADCQHFCHNFNFYMSFKKQQSACVFEMKLSFF